MTPLGVHQAAAFPSDAATRRSRLWLALEIPNVPAYPAEGQAADIPIATHGKPDLRSEDERLWVAWMSDF